MKSYNIENEGVIYNVVKEPYESTDVFLQRAWYIAKNKPNSITDFNRVSQLSFIWRNHYIYKTEYEPAILKLIQ